jgi:hypothetical protein
VKTYRAPFDLSVVTLRQKATCKRIGSKREGNTGNDKALRWCHKLAFGFTSGNHSVGLMGIVCSEQLQNAKEK